MKATNSYADVFLNEASLIHAQDREVVASWLPAQSKSANGSAEDAPEVAKQVFTVAPDQYVGTRYLSITVTYRGEV